MFVRVCWVCSSAILLLLLVSKTTFATDPIDQSRATVQAGSPLLWYEISLLGLEGQGWTDTKDRYDRLPAKAEGIVREPVWKLSHDAAGLCVRFVTDSPSIDVQWTLTSEPLAMHPHLTAVANRDRKSTRLNSSH